MSRRCPYCGAPLPTDDRAADAGAVRCSKCGGHCPASAEHAQSPAQESTPAFVFQAAELTLPKGVRVEEDGITLRLTHHWFSIAGILAAGLVAYVGWQTYRLATEPDRLPFVDFGLEAMRTDPFTLMLIGCTVFFGYGSLCLLVNRTVISVGDGTLSICHGPLPLLRGKKIPADRIDQLYCRQCGSKNKGGSRTTVFILVALLENGSKVRLCGPESDPRVLQYLEQQIERRLGIQDRPMNDEAAKPGKMHIVTESR